MSEGKKRQGRLRGRACNEGRDTVRGEGKGKGRESKPRKEKGREWNENKGRGRSDKAK